MLRLRIVKSCPESWDGMQRRAGGRHCEACDQVVQDLTRVTEHRAAALALLHGSSRMCGRILADTEGFAVFRPDRARETRSGWRDRSRGGALAAAMTLAAPMGCAPAAPAVPVDGADIPPAPSASVSTSSEDDAKPIASVEANAGKPDDAASCPQTNANQSAAQPRRIVIKTQGEMVVLRQVPFGPQSNAFAASQAPVLDEVAKIMNENPQIVLVHVIGHADGSETNPQQLGLARAQAIVNYLVKAGVDAARLVAESKGPTEPIDSNATVAGRAKNRRVQFFIGP